MTTFIKGMELCEGFFNEIAKPLLEAYYPGLKCSVGLIGYGSDVLGYDDAISTDHMWGPRFYLFLESGDLHMAGDILKLFSARFPYEYRGYSVNFSDPDPEDNGVRHAAPISSGAVSPLVFINTVEDFIKKYIGKYPVQSFDESDWLSFSENRLLCLTAGKMFVDALDFETVRGELRFYPEPVRLYLIASQWALIAQEQAFVRRCGDCGDDLGSRIVCARIIERLMRLCFLYKKRSYMPTESPKPLWAN